MDYWFVAFVALAVLKTAESLQCWKCQSRDDGGCADYFNQTVFRNSPRLFGSIDSQIPVEENCDSVLGFQITNQKPVCMKKVESINGRRHFTRKCEFVHIDLPVGECLKQVSEDHRVRQEFCQQCDTDYCNTASVAKTTVSWLIFGILLSRL